MTQGTDVIAALVDAIIVMVGRATGGAITITCTTAAGTRIDLGTAETYAEACAVVNGHICHASAHFGASRTESATNAMVAIFEDGTKLSYQFGFTSRSAESAVDDELHFEQLAAVDVGNRLRLTFDRLDAVSQIGDRLPSEYLVSFDKPADVVDSPELHPAQIPALIDELTVIYRQWRDLAAREGEL
ncbi:hypothetical protein [Rhodococcus rhodochrous]|nr:hypothetical protein [Rhodococcus rhodochrous]